MQKLLCFSTVVLAFTLGAAKAHGQVLEKISIQYYTTCDDKDHDTNVWTFIKKGDVQIAAKENYAGATKFKDPGVSDEYFLDIAKKDTTKKDLDKFIVTVESQANGNDNWEFDFKIKLYFKDGLIVTKEQKGVKLNSRGSQKVGASYEFALE